MGLKGFKASNTNTELQIHNNVQGRKRKNLQHVHHFVLPKASVGTLSTHTCIRKAEFSGGFKYSLKINPYLPKTAYMMLPLSQQIISNKVSQMLRKSVSFMPALFLGILLTQHHLSTAMKSHLDTPLLDLGQLLWLLFNFMFFPVIPHPSWSEGTSMGYTILITLLSDLEVPFITYVSLSLFSVIQASIHLSRHPFVFLPQKHPKPY